MVWNLVLGVHLADGYLRFMIWSFTLIRSNEFILGWTEEVLQGVAAGIDLFDSEYAALSVSYN